MSESEKLLNRKNNTLAHSTGCVLLGKARENANLFIRLRRLGMCFLNITRAFFLSKCHSGICRNSHTRPSRCVCNEPIESARSVQQRLSFGTPIVHRCYPASIYRRRLPLIVYWWRTVVIFNAERMSWCYFFH